MNGGGFLAGLLAILFIGIAMDAQGAGTPDTYCLEAFRIAFLTQVPLWALGAGIIIWERKRTRVHIGLDEPRIPSPRPLDAIGRASQRCTRHDHLRTGSTAPEAQGEP